MASKDSCAIPEVNFLLFISKIIRLGGFLPSTLSDIFILVILFSSTSLRTERDGVAEPSKIGILSFCALLMPNSRAENLNPSDCLKD